MEDDELDQIRKATNGYFALGGKQFQDEISMMLGRRVFRGKAGRPKKDVYGLSPILCKLADVAIVADANQVCSGIIRALKEKIRD
ncbi:hypothetical protein [Desulfobacter vibrioformis]|uniref:hypothetical protein n=1 Tax=Desulfobacter vibrioformis TaxID=34031 RepID=UPI00068E1FE8|nr:hypothetical protein [Desulfobacter vibrioformis]